MTFTIRKTTSDDAPGILACLRSAFQAYEKSYTPSAYQDTVMTAESLQERMQTMSIFVAVAESGEIAGTIGCAAAGGGEGHLRGMAVNPNWQGSGIAEELLASAESELCRMGCDHVTLDTTEPLKRAVRFYQKHGYSATRKVTDFFGMGLFEYAKKLKRNLLE